MKDYPKIAALLVTIAVAGFGAEIMGIAVPGDVAYLGGWSNRRSSTHFEVYAIKGISSKASDTPGDPTKSPLKGVFVAEPGDRKVAILVKASAESGLPGLKDGKVELVAHLEGGKLYSVRGTRTGDVVTVWMLDMSSQQKVSNEVSYDLRREVFVLIPVH
jgi:hypothetical protein